MEKDILLFRISCLSFGASAFVWLLAPFGNYRGNVPEVLIAILIGALFWAGLLTGIVLTLIISRHRKKNMKRRRASSRVGALRFFSNRKAMIADIAMILFLALTIALSFIPRAGTTLSMIAFSFLLFSVYMHCVLNGTNYQYINSIK